MIKYSETYLVISTGLVVGVSFCASSLFCALLSDVFAVVGQTRCCTAHVAPHMLSAHPD